MCGCRTHPVLLPDHCHLTGRLQPGKPCIGHYTHLLYNQQPINIQNNEIPADFHHYFSLLNLFKMLLCSHHEEHYNRMQCILILQKPQNMSTFSRTFSRLLKKEEIAKSHKHQRRAIELKYVGGNKMVPSRRIIWETFIFFYAVFLI